MNFIHAIILGIVEGITEFLPISSTGHLILTAHILRISKTEFLKSFEIAIQFGAILSVIVLYWKVFFLNFEIMKRVAAAFIPTAILGFIFYGLVKNVLLESLGIVLWSLFLGGLFLIVFELLYRAKADTTEELSKIPYATAVAIGLFQSLAMIPGISRAAATIIGGLLLGLRRKIIVEFSFLLAVPTMLAATALDLTKNASEFSLGEFQFLLVGFFISFVTAALAIKFLLNFIKRHNFVIFGFYRILLALIFAMIFVFRF